MKMNMLIGAILLSSIGLVADDNSIEYESSYQIMGMTYSDYNIKGNGEECSVTYREDEDFIEVTPNIYKARFTKRVRLENDSEWKDYPSYLLIDISTSSILVEGDEVTDKNKNLFVQPY